MSCHLDNTQTRKVKLKHNIWRSNKSLIPLIRWIISYSKIDMVTDLITGITIGLIIIPQSVAYVAIVGLSAKVILHFIHYVTMCEKTHSYTYHKCINVNQLSLYLSGKSI